MGETRKNNLNYIDGLKGLAILAVTTAHTGGGSQLPGILGRIVSNGPRGVQLFFLISGMLAYSSLNRAFPNGRIDVKGLFRWWGRKLLRLLPLYYLALVLSMLSGSWSAYWLGTEKSVALKNILTHVFLLHGLFPHYTDSILSVEWYIGVLWLFYLLTPIVYMVVNSIEKVAVFMMMVWLVNPVLLEKWRTALPLEADPDVYGGYYWTFCPLNQLLVYVLGFGLFYVLRSGLLQKVRCQRILSYTLLLFCVALLTSLLYEAPSVFYLREFELFGICFVILIISQAIHSSFLIDNIFFRTIGKYSYGMYLFQFIWLNFYEKYIHYQGYLDWTVKFVSTVVVLLVISYLLSRYYDEPIRKCIEKPRKVT